MRDFHCFSVKMGAEIAYGVNALPDGQRKTSLAGAVDRFIAQRFANRVVVFDQRAANQYGRIMATRRKAGTTMSVPDGQIAAAAASNDMTLATRNTKDFAGCGIDVPNPFE